MKLSKEFKIAVKLSDRPQYRICQEANVDPAWLSKALNGAISFKSNDHRLLALAKVLGINRERLVEASA